MVSKESCELLGLPKALRTETKLERVGGTVRKLERIVKMDYGDSKPKVYVNGKSAAKLRIGERSTTMG